eukprot:42388-Rhodomonas_salina.1
MIRQDPSGREEARLKQLELELYQDQVRVLESRANDLGDKKSAEKLQAARARVLELQLQTERQAAARTKQLEAWFDEADPSAARHGPGAAPVQVRTARAHAGEGGEDRKSHTMVGFLEETVRHLQKSLDNEQRQRTEETEVASPPSSCTFTVRWAVLTPRATLPGIAARDSAQESDDPPAEKRVCHPPFPGWLPRPGAGRHRLAAPRQRVGSAAPREAKNLRATSSLALLF